MTCWVAPTLAAELWQKSVDYVLSGVREGWIIRVVEKGFTFVEVEPNYSRHREPQGDRLDRPQTFVQVTPEELFALTAEPLEPANGNIVPADSVNKESAPKEESAKATAVSSGPTLGFRAARGQAAQRRKPPQYRS